MKQTFTILQVDDKPGAMKGQMKDVEKYLDKKDFKLELIIDETGETVEETLKTGDVDIVTIDKNLADEDEMSGIDVINVIRNNGFPIDVLFYSAIDFDVDEIHSKTDHYGFVEVVEGKTIVEYLKRLIDKNIKRCQDIVFLRGKIISSVIDLELKINDFFVKYFKIPEKNKIHFNNFILENKYSSLFGKKKTLSMILEENEIKQEFSGLLSKINHIEEQRNLLAHCKTDPRNKNILISMGEEETFDRKKINSILKKINVVSGQLDDLIEKFS
jgi:CheY-like chemotaxis protein